MGSLIVYSLVTNILLYFGRVNAKNRIDEDTRACTRYGRVFQRRRHTSFMSADLWFQCFISDVFLLYFACIFCCIYLYSLFFLSYFTQWGTTSDNGQLLLLVGSCVCSGKLCELYSICIFRFGAGFFNEEKLKFNPLFASLTLLSPPPILFSLVSLFPISYNPFSIILPPPPATTCNSSSNNKQQQQAAAATASSPSSSTNVVAVQQHQHSGPNAHISSSV